MKRFILFVLILFACVAAQAQSDCNADHCGMVPLMHMSNENGGTTDLYLYVNTDCSVYFRVRLSDPSGQEYEPQFHIVHPGEKRFVVENILGIWPEFNGSATLIIDWATYGCIPTVLAEGIFELDENSGVFSDNPRFFYGIREPTQLDPGCHKLYSGKSSSTVLHFYNEDDYYSQTVVVDGEIRVVLPRGTVEVSTESIDYLFEICIGEPPPGGSVSGLDLTLPLHVEGLSVVPRGVPHRIIYLR